MSMVVNIGLLPIIACNLSHIGGLQLLMTDVSGNIPFLRSSPLGQDFDQYLGDISGSNFVPRCWEAYPRSGENA